MIKFRKYEDITPDEIELLQSLRLIQSDGRPAAPRQPNLQKDCPAASPWRYYQASFDRIFSVDTPATATAPRPKASES